MDNNLVTIDTNNYEAMAKAMGIAGEGTKSSDTKKTQQLPRFRINHSAIMGETKMNGKNVKSIVTYLKRLPQQEFAAFVIKDAMNRTEDLKKELKRDDAVREWIMSIGKHLVL